MISLLLDLSTSKAEVFPLLYLQDVGGSLRLVPCGRLINAVRFMNE